MWVKWRIEHPEKVALKEQRIKECEERKAQRLLKAEERRKASEEFEKTREERKELKSQHLSAALKKRWEDPALRKKISYVNIGRKRTKKQRLKIAEGMRKSHERRGHDVSDKPIVLDKTANYYNTVKKL